MMATRPGYVPTVMVVEDDDASRSEIRQVLELNGYRVVDADNGRDAVASARDTHPDLLFVDLNVPLTYGLVAARQIVKKARLGQVPVVVVTREGADPYLTEDGVQRNEYVTRLTDYEQLEHLLDYLFPM